MSRATLFRIIGFGFLVFAALSLYRGEYGVGRTGGVIVTRAQDPASFWQGLLIQIGTGCVLLYLSRSRPPRGTTPLSAGDAAAQQAGPVEDRPKLPNYDPYFCGKVVRGAAAVCIGLIIAEVLVLLLVHPSDERCPGWIFHPNQQSSASLWLLAGMFSALPGLWMCYVALHWDGYYSRKTYDSIVSGSSAPVLMDVNWLMLIVVAGWCLFCAIPLFLMLGHCTPLYRYLTVFQ